MIKQSTIDEVRAFREADEKEALQKQVQEDLHGRIIIIEITNISWIDASYMDDPNHYIAQGMTVKASIDGVVVENVTMGYIPLTSLPRIKDEIIKNLDL